MATEFYFTPELHLKDGRIIGISKTRRRLLANRRLDRESDKRDEILHKMERAEGDEEAHAAAHRFLRWLEELDILE
jgi:hypothetical protein